MADRIATAVLVLKTDGKEVFVDLGNVGKALRDIGNNANEASQHAGGLSGVLQAAAGSFAGFISAQTIMRGVSAAFSFAKDAVFGMNSTLETSTLQFTTLMGDSDKAKDHVRDLFEFAKRTPFETGPIIEASRMMRTFGGDALDTKKNLQLLGDASAATGAPINELGFWVGRMFAMLQGGKPFGEAAMRLQELAVMTPQTRAHMEGLQAAGASANKIFEVFTGSLGTFGGAMEAQAATWAGVTSTFTDTVKILIADTFKPFFEMVRDGLGLINDALGSKGVAAAMDAFKVSVKSAFGNDSHAAVMSLAQGFLSFGDTVLGVIDLAYRGFEAFKSVVSLAVATVLEGITVTAEASSKALEIVAKADPTGKLAEWAQAGKENAAFMRGLTNEYWDQQKAAHAAAEGNSAVSITLDGMRSAIQATAANLASAKSETDSATESHKNLSRAAGDAGDSMIVAGKQAKKFKEDLAELALEVGRGLKTLTDAEFEKEFGSKLLDMQRSMEMFGITGTKVPQAIRDGLARLASLEMGDFFDKMANAAAAANKKIVEENAKTEAELSAQRLKSTDEIINQVVRTADLRTQNEIARRDDEFKSADYAIQQAQREGASKQDITRMERELSLARLNAAIADADAEFQHKTETLNRTTQFGQAEYQALADAHAIQVARMRDDWQHGQEAIQLTTTTTWHATIDTLAQSFAQLSQISGGCFSDITKGIGSVIGAISTADKSFTAFKGGMKDFTSGGDLKTVLGGLGGIVTGIGGIVAAATAAISAIKALFDAFRSEETKKVNKPRDDFQGQFGGFEGLASALTGALVSLGEEDAGAKASALLKAMNDADTEAKWKAAQEAIAAIFKRAGREVRTFAEGGIATRATLGVFGEAGAEAIIPLDRLSTMIGAGRETVQHITLSIGDRVIARSAVRGMPRELHLAGVG
jgi:hypothetical protein